MGLIARSSLIWLGFFVLAIINGAIREAGIKRIIDEPWAHHISAFTAIILFGLYAWLMRHLLAIGTTGEAMLIGIYWFVLTVLTETFIVGRWMGKHSWSEILANYDIFHGNLWPLVLIWVGVLPYVIYKIKGE
jgi:hypothetical protein